MKPIEELVRKVSISTIKQLKYGFEQGYLLANESFENVEFLNVPSVNKQLIYNYAVDFILSSMAARNALNGCDVRFLLNKQKNCKHSELYKSGVTMTVSSCNHSGKEPLPKLALFRQELAAIGQLKWEDFGSGVVIDENLIHQEYDYAIICHRYIETKRGKNLHLYIGIPDQRCYSWIDSSSVDDILDTMGDLHIIENALDKEDLSLQMNIKEEWLRRLKNMEG